MMDGTESVSPWQPIAHGPTSRRKVWRDERMDGGDVGVKKGRRKEGKTGREGEE